MRRTTSRSSTLTTRTGAGFTLIELLVVIAIIAILAAILFPVFARVRQKGYQASCQSNLKQIALAILAYADDYEGYGPLSHASGCYQDQANPGINAPGGFCNSALALAPYDAGWASFDIQQKGSPNIVSSWKISPLWQCHGNGTGTYKMLYSRGATWHLWEPQGGSYGSGSGGGKVRNVTTAALVGDCWGYSAMTDPAAPRAVYGYWYQFVTPRTQDDIRNGAPDYNSTYYARYMRDCMAHNGGNNMAFCDGHVKWLEGTSMIGDTQWWVSAFQ